MWCLLRMEDGRVREKAQLVLLSLLRQNKKLSIEGELYRKVDMENSSSTVKMEKSNREIVMGMILILPRVSP